MHEATCISLHFHAEILTSSKSDRSFRLNRNAHRNDIFNYLIPKGKLKHVKCNSAMLHWYILQTGLAPQKITITYYIIMSSGFKITRTFITIATSWSHNYQRHLSNEISTQRCVIFFPLGNASGQYCLISNMIGAHHNWKTQERENPLQEEAYDSRGADRTTNSVLHTISPGYESTSRYHYNWTVLLTIRSEAQNSDCVCFNNELYNITWGSSFSGEPARLVSFTPANDGSYYKTKRLVSWLIINSRLAYGDRFHRVCPYV